MTVDRRQFLAGSALLPFAHKLRLWREGRQPMRFVFLVRDNGLRPWEVLPTGAEAPERKGADALVDRPLGGSLNEHMAALAPVEDLVNVFQGLSGRMCTGAHGANFGALGAYRCGDHDPAPGPTVDALLVDAFPGIFRYLGLKMAAPDQIVSYSKISAFGRAKPMSLYADPMLAYMDLFGTLLQDGDLKAEFDVERNLLDFVVSDVRRERRQLVGAEREKLDQYLGGFEELRRRREQLTGMRAELEPVAPKLGDRFRSEVETERLEAHFELAAASLVAGLTNVVTIELDRLELHYTGLDLGQFSLHHIGHLEETHDADKYEKFANGVDGREGRRRILEFQMGQVGALAQKLAAVPEGDGTMLDNTLIVFLSDAADRHHAGFGNWPIVTVGNLGGRLRTGRFVEWPGYGKPGHRTIGNFHTTILEAAGILQAVRPDDGHFGQLDLGLGDGFDQRGPLREWLA